MTQPGPRGNAFFNHPPRGPITPFDSAPVIPMPPKFMTTERSVEMQLIDSLARAFMFLITMFPCLTQRGTREPSALTVATTSKCASNQCKETFHFLKNVLMALHVRITSASGLLNQKTEHGQEFFVEFRSKTSFVDFRRTEVELRELRMGLHQALEMCRSLTTLVAEEAQKVPGEHMRLAEVLAANRLVLGQLTQVATAVNQRVQQLSQERRRHDGGFVPEYH